MNTTQSEDNLERIFNLIHNSETLNFCLEFNLIEAVFDQFIELISDPGIKNECKNIFSKFKSLDLKKKKLAFAFIVALLSTRKEINKNESFPAN